MAKRSKINNREEKYELLRQSEHRDEQNHIANNPTQQLYRENYYEKDADGNYSLNSATQRSIQSSHERSQRKTSMQQRQATYNTGSASTVSRNLVDDVGKRYGYSRPTPKKQTLTSDDIRNDALNELKNRSTPSNATPSTATPSTATRTGNTQTTVSKSLVDYVAKKGNNRTAQATRHHAAMTDFANKGINKAIIDAVKAPINALRNAGGNPLKMADAEAEKMRKLERNPAAIHEQIRQYSEMTPGQKYMYNHLYDSQGRDAAEEYRSKIMDDINRRVAKQNVEGNIANKVAAGRVANQFVGGVTNSGEGLQKIAQWATLDNKKRAQSVNDYETQMRREKAGKVEGLLQDIASSTGNMAGSVALGNAIGTVGGLSSAAAAKLSSAAFGASQGGHAYQQAINEGHSALRSAAFAGEEAASEYLTEQILGGVKALGGSSWTRYSKLPGTEVVASKVADASTALLNPETEKMAMGQIKKAIIDGMRNKKVKEYLFNALREGSQEGLQYWTTGIARNIILDEGRDEDGNLNPVKGLSFSDPDFWYSAAVGAINSMVMNAGTDLARSAVNNSKAYENYRYEQQFNNKKYVNMNDSMFSEVDPYTGNDGYTEFTEAPVQGEDMQPPTTYGTTFSDTETPGDIFRDNNITVTTEDSGSDTKDATNAAVDKLKKTRKKRTKTADDTKNVADATHDAVNEAVDALKERSEQNTADSTPDAAKEATQAAVEAINTEDAAPVAQETEDSQDLIQEPTAEESQDLIEEPKSEDEPKSSADIIDQAFNQGGIINQDAINHASPEDLQKIVDIFEGKHVDSDESAPAQQRQAPEQGTNESAVNSGRKLTTDQLRDKLKGNGKFTADQIEYGITASDDGYVGGLRDTKNDKFGGVIVDGRALRYVTKPYESRDAVINDLTEFAENNGLTRNKEAAAEADSLVSGGILQPDVADALTDRAYKRFGTKEAERRTYIDFFTLGSEQWPAVDASTVYKWDDFMSKVYQAGLNGEPYSRLSQDSNFAEFYKMPIGPDATDAMWKLGYNQYNIRMQKQDDEKKEEPKAAPKEASKPAPEAKASPAAPEEKPVADSNPQSSIADRVAEKVASGQSFTANWLFDVANNSYGGTMADGTYSVKDAYDGMELGINKYLMNADFVKAGNGSLEDALNTLSELQSIMRNIPTQTKRTEEMESYQQFSTPPTIAFTAARLANITSDDVVLEPSAGIGGLALWGKAWGAKVYGNELSKRRLAFLNELGLDGTFNENAEQINNVLPDDVQPTVVIMNPPFSSTAGRMKTNKTANAKRHIEQALDRLQEGGRLVAILGRGMSDDAPAFSAWWNDLRREYTIRSNVRIDGSNYQKYGTTFDDQLVVIDKVGPQEGKTLTGEYKDLSELLTDLEGVRNERRFVEQNTKSGNLVQGGSTSEKADGVADELASNAADGRRNDTGRNGRMDSSRGSGTGARVRNGSRASGSAGSTEKPKKSGERVSESEPGTVSDQHDGKSDGNVRLVHGDVQGSQRDVSKPKINIDSKFTAYEPAKVHIEGAKPHPGKLVESAAMGAVEPPTPTYTPHLPQSLIDSGKPSSAQLENIVYAGQAHSQILPSGERKGYFIGDGTGVGKGVQIASILLDNFNQGRRKAVWVSKNPSLRLDAQRDWSDIGQNASEIYDFSKFKNSDIPYDEGIMFASYKQIGDRKQDGIDTLTKWLGKDFDGVIVFDEAHMMKNAIPTEGKGWGKTSTSQMAVWGVKLQQAFPNARILYATATGASDISNFAYLDRLGLWGKGTPFSNFNDFYEKISSGGLAAMELVARDMKAMGSYMARSISYEGVEYDTVEHDLTPAQTKIYDTMSDGWRIVLQNLDSALEITGQSRNRNARAIAVGQFWSRLQSFYNQIITSMAMPSVIDDIRKQLDDGRSVVIQLTNTNEAAAKRKIAENEKNGGDLENLDLTPSESLIDYLKKSFPVQVYEDYEDENGNRLSRPVKDSQGNPVLDKRAVALRDQLITKIGKMKVPDGPLEMLLDEFGTENVAEVTGRTRRVVNQRQADGSVKRIIENRSVKSGEADAKAFQNGTKRILVFSESGGTGKSYHADRRAKNQQQRVHYILQPGWKADAAIQGLGRTHRTNEASAPIYKLVTTNVMGQKRFTATIAKRLNQLGALTQGQRDAGSGIFSEKDNLETPIAADALENFYRSADRDLIKSLGINIYEKGGFAINESAPDLRNVPKFLNRILSLKVEDQNKVFNEFYSLLNDMTETAIQNGTLDRGMESVKADKIEVIDKKTVHVDERTGAETQYVQMKVYRKPTIVSFKDMPELFYCSDDEVWNLYIKEGRLRLCRFGDGSVRAVYKMHRTETDTKGRVHDLYEIKSPVYEYRSIYQDKTLEKLNPIEIPKNEWEDAWNEEIKKTPKYLDSNLHLLTGVLLPVWDKIENARGKVLRVVTSDGTQYLGREISPSFVDTVLRSLNQTRTKKQYTLKELMSEILDSNQEVALKRDKWRLRKRRVSGEWRIELTGTNTWQVDDMPGIIKEIINSEERYFIPTGKRGEAVIESIIADNPVSDVRPVSSDDGVLHSMSKHDDTGDKSGGVLNSKKNPTPSEDGEKPEERWTAKKNEDSAETSSKRLSDIIGQAAHDWGFNMTSGTRYVKGEGNMGEFNEQNRGIRTKTTNDLPTFSHEFGHWLDKTYNITGSARLPKEVRKDIETAFLMNPDNADLYSGKSKSEKLKEGLAEFVRYYLQNRDTARIDFPKLTDYVLKQMSPGELAKFNGLADQVNAYYSMDAGDAKSSIRLKEDSRPDYRTNMEKFHDWYHGWYQENVDSVHGFREFDVRNGTNTYTYATNAAYTDARVAQTIIEGIYDLDGNYIGPGMKDVFVGIDVNNKEVYISFGEYLVLKHGLEWIAQGKRVFADDRKNNAQWIENRIAEIEAEHPEFIEAADRLYKFESDFMWTYAVGEGLISADAYKAMQKENPCYVPFFRAGFKERGNSLFKAKGSGRDLIHPVDNIIDNITKLQNAAARNAVMLQLRREAVRSKADALFMEKMPDPKVPVEVDLRGIKDRLYNETHDIAGIEIAPEMQDALQEVIGSIDDTMTQFQLGKAKPNRGEIKILVAGKPEFWKINDPLLLSSITSMDYRNASKVITAFGAVSRFITSNITGNNVIWSIFSNAPRDLQTLLTYSMATKNPGKMLQGVADTYLNYINNARGKSVDPLFSEYLAMGGEGAPVWSGSKDYVKDMRKLLSSTREHPEMNPLKWAMFVSDMIEMGPRFATYKMCREAGMNPQKAFYAAMDITVNFRRNGINSKTLNQFIPFFNAGVQATDKMIRYFTAEDLREMKFVGGAGDGGDGGDGTGKWVEVNGKERGRAIAGRIAFSAALSLIMAALVVAWSRRNKESKDDFDMLSNYTKNSYFCISLGDGKYFTIPKGQNVAVLESFFERLLERTVGDNDHAFDEYYSYLTDSTLPSIVSDLAEYPVNVVANGVQSANDDFTTGFLGSLGAVGEMSQLRANKDYLNRPIVSKQNEGKVPALQYTEKSSEMAYLLGKYLGISPQKADHFGKNILGWMWSYPSALFPINDGKGVQGKRDWTMGVKNTYLRDNVYSNDLSNWIYDKASESDIMYSSYGTNEQALESTLDSNMKSYYQKTIGLAKGQEDEREIRRAALDKLKAYRKESDHGVEDADRKAIYDIVESNGNAAILPGVMDTSIKSDGKTYDLSGKEYMQYQDAYESYYYDLADDCINPSDSEDKQSKIAGDLKQLAREQAMDEILSKKGIESGKPSKLKDWTDAGYDAADYFSLKEEMDVAKVGKDGDDRRKAVKKVLRGSGLSADAQKKLWEIAGYKASTFKKY